MNDFVPTVLIADDSDDSRLLMKTILELWNYRIIEAEDGSRVLDIIEEEAPDIILMDVKMPVLDGFETARKIRQSENFDGVPIIFLSGCAEKTYRQRAIESGGNEYLVKPLDFDLLEITLNKYLNKPQETAQSRLQK